MKCSVARMRKYLKGEKTDKRKKCKRVWGRISLAFGEELAHFKLLGSGSRGITEVFFF